ncbi:tetraprenyl-beta-curcumene synthase family protein [Peribacillus cavernae]|uniref:Tetraprenyl-beta-curcumene synthase family protein n=1 Tax=Peribacillus cavernae TaxID=1674310 RepID=A0A433HUT7_9BACI|nr:tetraprenyl-beta-curcumene synthase family protein [Peribacillus cavernae]MDQ0220284.1 tetraprenyl-beta-curcumene synthase [Peribacillus cavernae]RUQ31944.1 tetraprenyl-beta-curcumene synthase family protein [Peribacillus cavernae]
MSVPTNPLALMKNVYRDIFPIVHEELMLWTKRAETIPDQELRKQAMDSISSKTFHCEGGSILALVAEEKRADAIRFIVAYQTISDYLDNLCDRSTSLDPEDFKALHESMHHSLDIDAVQTNYYRYRAEQDDGGYLRDLVGTCQSVLQKISNYPVILPYLKELCSYYCDLQVHKHVTVDERIPRLQSWFDTYKEKLPTMSWYEFSACSGSTLGIFCLVSYSLREDFEANYADIIREGYFPYIQGLHILLDYLIDQEEDKDGGDLNFCFYYKNDEELFERFSHFVKKSDQYARKLPHKRFHQLIHRGLLGLYLSDDKVKTQKGVKLLAKRLIRFGGFESIFFYFNGRAYRNLKKRKPGGLSLSGVK